LALAATLQASACIPNFLITEYFVNFATWAKEVAVNPFQVESGYLALPQGPGLGLELREEALGRYSYRGFPLRPLPMY